MVTRRRVGRPPDGDSSETRARILRAARDRFARDGFRTTTNRLIADDVGITSGAIYHYFDSKAALYAAVYCDTIDEVYTELERAASAEQGLLARYGAVLRTACAMQQDDRSITGFLAAVAVETGRQPALLSLMSSQRGRHARFFTELVEGCADDLEPDIDRAALADLLAAVMTGLARTVAATREPQRYAAAVDVLQRFVDGTLLRPAPQVDVQVDAQVLDAQVLDAQVLVARVDVAQVDVATRPDGRTRRAPRSVSTVTSASATHTSRKPATRLGGSGSS